MYTITNKIPKTLIDPMPDKKIFLVQLSVFFFYFARIIKKINHTKIVLSKIIHHNCSYTFFRNYRFSDIAVLKVEEVTVLYRQ